MRVAVLCEEAAGARALQLVLAAGHEVAALLTSAGSPAWTIAQRAGLEPLAPGRVRDPGFALQLARLGVDLLLNVHSLYIVPEPVLRVPKYGAFNLHPGPLPEYAGLNAPSWAIYNGETCHGVTLHRMAPGIDTGPIAFEERFALTPQDTGLSVSLRCAQLGVALIERLLGCDLARLALAPQDLSRRCYFGRGVPQGGRIDWRASARRIDAFVRACDYRPFPSPWGTPIAEVGGRPIQVLKTGLTGERCAFTPGTVRTEDGRTWVATGDEWLAIVCRRSDSAATGPLQERTRIPA